MCPRPAFRLDGAEEGPTFAVRIAWAGLDTATSTIFTRLSLAVMLGKAAPRMLLNFQTTQGH